MLNYVTWTASPNIFDGFVTVRWYGVMFAIGFWFGYEVVYRIFKHEGAKEKWVNNWIYSKWVTKKPMLWTFDRVVVPVGLVAALIRIGNLMNHEIYGGPTTMPWGFKFITNDAPTRYLDQFVNGATPTPEFFTVPCHPTQIYEALCYLLIFGIVMWMYWKRNLQERQGLIFGVFMLGIFVPRFFIEFLKNVQEAWEIGLRQSCGLDMGQILSIPFIILGVWLVVRAMLRPREHLEYPNRFADAK